MFLTVRCLRAERQPDADLLRPLLDRVRHQSVDADRRQQQRRAAEHRHQHMLKRWRDVERDTTSVIVRTSDTGRPLAWRSCS